MVDTTISYPVDEARRLRVSQRVSSAWEPGREPEPAVLSEIAEQVRHRFAEAMNILRRLPHGATDRPSTKTGATLPVIHSTAEAYGHWVITPKEPPTAEEISRMDATLEWLWWIPADWRKAVVGVAIGAPLRRIARRMGCSHEHVRKIERKGIERIARRVRSGA